MERGIPLAGWVSGLCLAQQLTRPRRRRKQKSTILVKITFSLRQKRFLAPSSASSSWKAKSGTSGPASTSSVISPSTLKWSVVRVVFVESSVIQRFIVARAGAHCADKSIQSQLPLKLARNPWCCLPPLTGDNRGAFLSMEIPLLFSAWMT